MKTARSASDDAYRALVKMVNALALVFGETDYADFIDYVNTEITHYKREVLGQKATATTTGGTSTDSDNESSSSSGGSDESTSGGSSSSGGSSTEDNPLL